MARLPPVTATLARMVLYDMARRTGASFPHPDRLSRQHAQALLNYVTQSKAMMAELRQLDSVGKDAFALYHRVVSHFAYDHPTGASGEPAPFERPAFQPSSADASFAAMHPDDAAGLLAWVNSNAEARATLLDSRHPERAALLAQVGELRVAVADPAASGDFAGTRAPPPAPAAIEAEAARIRATPEFLDGKHPQHRARVEELTALTQRDVSSAVPVPAPAAAAPAPAPGARPAAAALPAASHRERIAALQRDPAYLSKSYPDHAAKVEEMTAIFQELHPEPSAAVA